MATSQRGTEDPSSPHGRPPGRSLHLGRGHTAGLHRHPCLHTSSRVAPHPQHRQGPLDWAPSVLLVVPLRWGLAEAHGPKRWGWDLGWGSQARPPVPTQPQKGGRLGTAEANLGQQGDTQVKEQQDPRWAGKRRQPRTPRALPCLCRGQALLDQTCHLRPPLQQSPPGATRELGEAGVGLPNA